MVRRAWTENAQSGLLPLGRVPLAALCPVQWQCRPSRQATAQPHAGGHGESPDSGPVPVAVLAPLLPPLLWRGLRLCPAALHTQRHARGAGRTAGHASAPGCSVGSLVRPSWERWGSARPCAAQPAGPITPCRPAGSSSLFPLQAWVFSVPAGGQRLPRAEAGSSVGGGRQSCGCGASAPST